MLRRNAVGLFLAILFVASEAGTANAQGYFYNPNDDLLDLPSSCASGRYSAFDPIYVCQRACGRNPGPRCRITFGPDGSSSACGHRWVRIDARKHGFLLFRYGVSEYAEYMVFCR